jgi:hypothetical protein
MALTIARRLVRESPAGRRSLFVRVLLAAGSMFAAPLLHASPRDIGLADLTVPTDRLPAGCALVGASSQRLDGNQVRTGLWTGLNIPTNPWVGADASVIAEVRGRLDPPRMPDGPPLGARDAARFHLQLADGIEQGYVAIYGERDASVLITVYGFEFRTPEAAARFAGHVRAATDSNSVVSGRIAAFAFGPATGCSKAIGAFVGGLSR